MSTVESTYLVLFSRYIRSTVTGDVRVLSAHDTRCMDAVDTDLSLRYRVDWLPELTGLNNPSLLYLRTAVPGRTPYTNNTIVTGANYCQIYFFALFIYISIYCMLHYTYLIF